MLAVSLERLDDLDAPRGGNTSAILPPFEASCFTRPELCCGGIHELPCKGCFGHAPSIGQIVQNVKDNLPDDDECVDWHNSSMPTPSDYTAEFLARVRDLRLKKDWSAKQMAKALGIPAERYRKYESRTPLPHELLEQFALITGVTVEYLITGNPPESLSKRRRAKGRAADTSKSESETA